MSQPLRVENTRVGYIGAITRNKGLLESQPLRVENTRVGEQDTGEDLELDVMSQPLRVENTRVGSCIKRLWKELKRSLNLYA